MPTHQQTIATLQQENQHLREQVEALTRERDLWNHQNQDETQLPGSSSVLHPYLTGPVVLFTWAAQEGWPVEYVSPNISRFGYTADDFLTGRVSYPSIIYSEDQERVAREVAQYSAEGLATFEQDYRIVTAEGEPRWIYDYTTIVRDSTGTITHYIGYILDITERKQQEENLHVFRALADNALDGVTMSSLEGYLTYANPAFQAMSGLHDQLSQVHILDLYPPEIRPLVEQDVIPTVQQQGSWQGVLELRRPDGKRWQAQHSAFVVYDAAGQIHSMANVVRDITEQQQQAEELHRQAQILEQVRGSIVVVDMEGIIISCNRDSLRLFGYTSDESIGQPIISLYPPEEHERLLTDVIQPLQEQGELETETVVCAKDGKRIPILLSLSLLRDDNGTPVGMIGFSTDISERERALEEQRRLVALIENSSDFIGMASLEGHAQYVNQAGRTMMGLDSLEAVRQTNVSGYYTPEDRAWIERDALPQVFSTGVWIGEVHFKNFTTGEVIPVHHTLFIIRDQHNNEPVAMGTITRNISQQKQAEAERAALQQQVIEAQRDALRELSTPLIPITDEVVIMPLIGTIDSQRAQLVMETLLEGVAQHRSSLVILDITGVSIVDTQVAQAFIQAAQAVKLLGAQVMLTGIQPQIAQTLVHLGVDLSGIQTRGSLQAGIASALHNR